MIKTIDAIFDGDVLRPAEPLDIEPNTRVKITVDVPDPKAQSDVSFLDTARDLNLDGPPDWSEKIDSYLYREPTGSDA